MCGRTACTLSPVSLISSVNQQFPSLNVSTFANPKNYFPTFNGCPGNFLPVIRQVTNFHNEPKEREALESKRGSSQIRVTGDNYPQPNENAINSEEKHENTIKLELNDDNNNNVKTESDPSHSTASASIADSSSASASSSFSYIIQSMHWGLIPFFTKLADVQSTFSRQINARAETISTNSFKRLLKKNRCVVVVDGFYEWKAQVEKSGAISKIPMFIHTKPEKSTEANIENANFEEFRLKPKKMNSQDDKEISAADVDEEEKLKSEISSWPASMKPLESFNERFPPTPFENSPLLYLAGLYDFWSDPSTGARIWSVSILTTEPTREFAAIHDRMPVILADRDRIMRWIDCGSYSFEQCFNLLSPYSDNRLTHYPVSNAVGSIKMKSIDCVIPRSLVEAKLKANGIGKFFGSNNNQTIKKENQTQTQMKLENNSASVGVKTEESNRITHAESSESAPKVKIESDFIDRTAASASVSASADSPIRASPMKLKPSPSKKRAVELLPGQMKLNFGSPAAADKKLKFK